MNFFNVRDSLDVKNDEARLKYALGINAGLGHAAVSAWSELIKSDTTSHDLLGKRNRPNFLLARTKVMAWYRRYQNDPEISRLIVSTIGYLSSSRLELRDVGSREDEVGYTLLCMHFIQQLPTTCLTEVLLILQLFPSRYATRFILSLLDIVEIAHLSQDGLRRLLKASYRGKTGAMVFNIDTILKRVESHTLVEAVDVEIVHDVRILIGAILANSLIDTENSCAQDFAVNILHAVEGVLSEKVRKKDANSFQDLAEFLIDKLCSVSSGESNSRYMKEALALSRDPTMTIHGSKRRFDFLFR